MSDEVKESLGLITIGLEVPVRNVFPNLWTPKAFKDRRGKESGDAKYSDTFLLEPDSDDFKRLKEVAKVVAKAKWPDRKMSELAFCFSDGAKEAEKSKAKGKDGSFYEGMIVVKARTKYPPAVLDGRKSPPVETMDQKLIHSGCLVAAELNLVAYEGVGANPDGVNAYLNSVCYAGKGERIGGKDHKATFRSLKGSRTSEDPTGGSESSEDDDEIPF